MKTVTQTKILKLTSAQQLATGFVGIFFLFFIQQKFNLSFVQILFWFAIIETFFGLLVLPINYWCAPKIGFPKMIAIGLALEAIFYGLLASDLNGNWIFTATSLIYLASWIFFWPSFNYLVTKATADAQRGNFLGNFKSIVIFINLIMPIITGWLLDQGSGQYILILSGTFYLLTIYIANSIVFNEKPKRIPLQKSLSHLKKLFFAPPHCWGFLPDLTMSVMWIVWPLYFQWIVGKFVIMGIITSITAAVEILANKILGKLTDAKSAKKLLQTHVWFRVLDLNLRALFIVFSPVWFVTLIQSIGAFLGPSYQIPFETRLMEIGEEQLEDSILFDYFVVREIYLGLGRGLIMSGSALLVWGFGNWAMGIIIGIAGITALGARKL